LNVDWDGTLEGKSLVIDYLPEGMEPVYIRQYWKADYAGESIYEPIPELENQMNG